VDGKLACEATLTCAVVKREQEKRAHGDEPATATKEHGAGQVAG